MGVGDPNSLVINFPHFTFYCSFNVFKKSPFDVYFLSFKCEMCTFAESKGSLLTRCFRETLLKFLFFSTGFFKYSIVGLKLNEWFLFR